MIKTVATYPGTATDTVKLILKGMGIGLNIITSHKDLEKSRHDAIILLGGRDINPAWYGEANIYGQKPDMKRDIIEWTMTRRAMTLNQPIFGICRGHQMIAVAHGGSLYQDIAAQKAAKNHPIYHRLEVTGKLKDYMPIQKVNSLHHQAIRKPPVGFKVLAFSHDNIIEAIWRPRILGVQFHPELMIQNDERWIGLFRWLANGLV